jgi:hypothetical protein
VGQAKVVAKIGERTFTLQELAALVKADYESMMQQRATAERGHEIGTVRNLDLRITWLKSLIDAELWGQLAIAVYLGRDPPGPLVGPGYVIKHITEEAEMRKEEAEMEAAREKGKRRRAGAAKVRQLEPAIS